MKRGIFLSVLGIWLATNCEAQETTSKRELAEELLNLMNGRETIEEMLVAIKQMMPVQMESKRQAGQTNIPVNVSVLAGGMVDMISMEISWNKIKGDFVQLYADTFTEKELKGSIAFYKSPVGQAFKQKQPELMKRSAELSQKLMLKVVPVIQCTAMNLNTPSVKQKENK